MARAEELLERLGKFSWVIEQEEDDEETDGCEDDELDRNPETGEVIPPSGSDKMTDKKKKK
jgi:hypothetical protein